ncbi:MAG: hypothetical protein EOP06_22700 [Proteobacteria bacterium]|nr:MAG: hypothetical protein EOP06_22700 [Pseudomonadota bacterium]
MSGGLQMPKRGEGVRMLAELNAEQQKEQEPEPEDDSSPATNEETNERYNVTTLQRSNEPSNEETPARRAARSKKASNQPASEELVDVSGMSEEDIRFRRGLQIAQDDEKNGDIDVNTIRVSTRLHKYMEQYIVRRNATDPKGARKYRKQDAIAEAFALFYAHHTMPPAPSEDL